MKRITVREMKWINKGNYRNLKYDRIEAKGNDSFLYAISDENFNFYSTHYKTENEYSLYIPISDITFIKFDLNKTLTLTTSIKGYISVNNYSNLIKDLDESFSLSLKREEDYIYIFINDYMISKVNLTAAKNAISFGFLFNNKEFVKIDNIKYNK